MPNRFIPIQGGTSPEQQLAVINKNFAELDHETTTKLFYDSNGIPSISIGIQQDKTSRIRIAKPGFDVTTATDDQLAFNSSQNVFKIVGTGTHTVTKAASSQAQADVIDISSFALTSPPIVMATILDGGFYYTLPYHTVDESGTTNGGRVSASFRAFASSSTSLVIETRTPNYVGNGLYTSQLVTPFRYYILQETAAVS